MARLPDGKRNPRFPPPTPRLPNGLTAVYIEWIDSATTPGWQKAEDATPQMCYSVGIEVRRSSEAIVLSKSYNGGTLFSDQLTIPIKAIKRIVKLL